MTIVWIFFCDRNVDAIFFSEFERLCVTICQSFGRIQTRVSAYTYLDLKPNYKGSIPGLYKSQAHGHPGD